MLGIIGIPILLIGIIWFGYQFIKPVKKIDYTPKINSWWVDKTSVNPNNRKARSSNMKIRYTAQRTK